MVHADTIHFDLQTTDPEGLRPLILGSHTYTWGLEWESKTQAFVLETLIDL